MSKKQKPYPRISPTDDPIIQPGARITVVNGVVTKHNRFPVAQSTKELKNELMEWRNAFLLLRHLSAATLLAVQADQEQGTYSAEPLLDQVAALIYKPPVDLRQIMRPGVLAEHALLGAVEALVACHQKKVQTLDTANELAEAQKQFREIAKRWYVLRGYMNDQLTPPETTVQAESSEKEVSFDSVDSEEGK